MNASQQFDASGLAIILPIRLGVMLLGIGIVWWILLGLIIMYLNP